MQGTRTANQDPRVDHIDYQRRSVFLTDGQRLGFAQARRILGLDI